MNFRQSCRWIVCAALVASALPAAAQTAALGLPATPSSTGSTPAADVAVAPLFSSLFTGTVSDFKHVPTRSNLAWLGIGAAAAFAGHFGDTGSSREFSEQRSLDPMFKPGTVIGSAPAQMGASLLTYAIGRSMGSGRTAQVGADLFRAQAIAQSLSYGLKWTSRRTRPDGTSFSFPSGHAAVAFASASVLQRDLGWKAGVPAYALATYVAASRVQQQRHYLSDVAFGAVIGLVAGRTVTVGRGDHRFAVAPMAAPGGGGVSFNWLGKH